MTSIKIASYNIHGWVDADGVSNLERVVAVKGAADNERALYMRMHLLQGVVAFHKGHRHQAAQILARAEGELKVSIRSIHVPQIREL